MGAVRLWIARLFLDRYRIESVGPGEGAGSHLVSSLSFRVHQHSNVTKPSWQVVMNAHRSFPVTCRKCAMFVFFPEDKVDYTCQKCKLIKPGGKDYYSLWDQDGEEFINWSLDVLHTEEVISQRDNNMVDWPNETTQNATAQPQRRWTRWHSVPLEERNRFQAFAVEAEMESLPAEVSQTQGRLREEDREIWRNDTGSKSKMLVIGDFLLRGMEQQAWFSWLMRSVAYQGQKLKIL